jgi:hypothetical protein
VPCIGVEAARWRTTPHAGGCAPPSEPEAYVDIARASSGHHPPSTAAGPWQPHELNEEKEEIDGK